MRIVAPSLLVMLIMLPAAASSQNCVEPPFTERYEFAGSLTEVGSGVDCRLEARLTGVANGAATVHTVRRDASESLVMNFRVDLSGLTGQNLVQSVSLASAVSNLVVGEAGDAESDLFRILVLGNVPGTARMLGIAAACEACSGNRRFVTTPLTSAQPFIRIELDIGATTQGELRIWVDADATDPPTLTLANLDNQAWVGVDRLSVGLGSPSPSFLNAFADVPITFDRIGIDDPQWFYAGFEPEGVACDGLALPSNSTISGNTCAGDNLSPTLASGSTSARSLESIYRFSLAEPRERIFTINSTTPGLAAFVCHDFCGPGARCVGASSAGTPLPVALPAGDDRVIVKQTIAAGTCGEFTLSVDGTLD